MSSRSDYKRPSTKMDQNNPKLEWMYKGSSDLLNREEYLLGRSIDKNFEQLESETKSEQQKLIGVQVPKNHVEYECIPFSIREYKHSTQNTEQVDLQRKIMEDPLIAIKQKEIDTRKKLLENPVKLKEIHRLLKIEEDQKKKVHRKNSSKNSSKKKKHRKSSSDSNSSDTDLDRKLVKKLKKSGELDKLMKKKYDALTKELDSSVGKNKRLKRSKSSEVSSNDNHYQRHSKRKSADSDSDSDDELDEILTKKFKSIKDTAGLRALLAESEDKKTKPRKRSNSDTSESSSFENSNFNRKAGNSTEHKNPFREQSGFKSTMNRGNYRGGRGVRGSTNWNRRGNYNRGGQTSRGNFNSSYSRTNNRYQRSRSRGRFPESISKEKYQRSRSRSRQRNISTGRENMSNKKIISKNYHYRKSSSFSPENKSRYNRRSLSRDNSTYKGKNYEKNKLRLDDRSDFIPNKNSNYKVLQRTSREYIQKPKSSRSRSYSRSRQVKKPYERAEASTSFDNRYRNDSSNSKYQKPKSSRSRSYSRSRQVKKPYESSSSSFVKKTDYYEHDLSNHQDYKQDRYDSKESRSTYDRKDTSPRKSGYSKKISSRNSGSFHSDSDDKNYETRAYKKRSISREKKSRSKDNQFIKKKLSENEKERLRQEMMEAATKRDIERTQKVHTYRKEVEKEENIFKSSKFDVQFANNELKKAYSSSKSIESRIKSNLNNIQRSSGAMDRNFARK